MAKMQLDEAKLKVQKLEDEVNSYLFLEIQRC
jgi:hypothetical protein